MTCCTIIQSSLMHTGITSMQFGSGLDGRVPETPLARISPLEGQGVSI